MLELRGLAMRAGDFSLQPVSLMVGEGDCHVILGPTGSGKTVLLETVLGLRSGAAGQTLLAGEDITGVVVEQRGIGYVPQDLALFPHLDVLENIRFGNRVRHASRRVHTELIDELINAVKIGHLLHRLPDNLSGGERQRVALVRAIASGCKVLLLDEPFSSVNESMKKDLWLMMKELQKRFGLTLLMITHDLEEAFFLGDHLSVLIDGRLHQSDIKHNVYQQPASIEVAQFFGIKNLFGGVLNRQDDGRTLIQSSALHCELEVDGQEVLQGLANGAEVSAGIRANEVMVLREDADPARWANTMSGRVHAILDKGAAYTVLFRPDTAAGLDIEIELNSHAYRRLGLYEGKDIRISLKKENLFVIG